MIKPFPDRPAVRRIYWTWEKALVACLPRPEPRILCALSGGCDSMVLARLLLTAQERGLCTVTAGHVNHGLRPEAADDEAFVRRQAAAWSLNLLVERVEVAAHASASGRSTEQAARRLRLQALAGMAHAAGSTLIALGHHLDDQAETVLLRILRGAGPRGLGAMAPCEPLPRDLDPGRALMLIRPQLGLRRGELEETATTLGLSWQTDASNADPAMLRNRVRHELLPHLAELYNPRIAEALAELAHWERAADEIVTALVDEARPRARLPDTPGRSSAAPRIDGRALAGEPEAVASRLLWQAYQELAGSEAVLSSHHVRQLLHLLQTAAGPASEQAEVHLPGRIRARLTDGRLVFEHHEPRAEREPGMRDGPVNRRPGNA